MKITTKKIFLTPRSFSELKPGDVFFTISNLNNDREYFMVIKAKGPYDDNVISLKNYEPYFCFDDIQVFLVNAELFVEETENI